MKRALAAVAFVLLASAAAAADAPSAAAASGDRVIGTWLTEGGKAQVRIERVGDRYQGAIVWLQEPLYPADDDQGMAGKVKIDRENPDASKRAAPILGLRIVAGFRYDGEEWRDGTIYDPENGKTYKCRMWFEGETLRVRGYIGFSLLGRSQDWTRVAEAP